MGWAYNIKPRFRPPNTRKHIVDLLYILQITLMPFNIRRAELFLEFINALGSILWIRADEIDFADVGLEETSSYFESKGASSSTLLSHPLKPI